MKAEKKEIKIRRELRSQLGTAVAADSCKQATKEVVLGREITTLKS
jgi:hypothetical protein